MRQVREPQTDPGSQAFCTRTGRSPSLLVALRAAPPSRKSSANASRHAEATADEAPGLFEAALPLGIDEPPAVLDEFTPGVSLGAGDGELGLKLGVNRLVVEDNGVGVLVWRASGVDERMDRGGHVAGHDPVARAGSLVGLAVTIWTPKMAADG